MINNKQKLTLDRSVTYQIKVPGVFDKKKIDWDGVLEIIVENDVIFCQSPP
jgi:hypothetical protein